MTSVNHLSFPIDSNCVQQAGTNERAVMIQKFMQSTLLLKLAIYFDAASLI